VGLEGVASLSYYLVWLAGFIGSVILIGFWLSIVGFFSFSYEADPMRPGPVSRS